MSPSTPSVQRHQRLATCQRSAAAGGVEIDPHDAVDAEDESHDRSNYDLGADAGQPDQDGGYTDQLMSPRPTPSRPRPLRDVEQTQHEHQRALRHDAPDQRGEIARLEPPLGKPDKKDAQRVAVGNAQRRKIMDRDCRGQKAQRNVDATENAGRPMTAGTVPTASANAMAWMAHGRAANVFIR